MFVTVVMGTVTVTLNIVVLCIHIHIDTDQYLPTHVYTHMHA